MTLEARAIAIGYGTREVAAGIDATLAAGEVTCLLGPNGGGKTTLLRTLLGLLRPLAGGILLDGRSLAQWSTRERAQRLAYVPQATTGDFDFSLLEVVEMGRTPGLGLFAAPRVEDRLAALEALERLGIAHLAARAIGEVSGGERQLAYIARALATRATHLLMDEPTASLDFANQALILDEIARLAGEGTSVLFTTHHPDHALRIADRALLLGRGSVVAAGPASATLNSENLSALYGRAVEVAEVASTEGPPGRFCIVRESRRFD
jgi:iron complex transport system ATP-binding protein